MDFVAFTADRLILCLIPKPPAVDLGLFIRPFTTKALQYVIIITCIGLAFLFIPYYFLKTWADMKAKSLVVTSMWFFYVLIQCFYGGAMTMFFVSEISIPFNTLRDVLKVFPEWNLIMVDPHQDTYFKLAAEQVKI